MQQEPDLSLYATVGVGLENLVVGELRTLGIIAQRIEPGRVRFRGSPDDIYRTVIHLRCVSRVVLELSLGEVYGEQDIYDAVRAIDWSAWLTPHMSLRVQLNAHSSLLRSSRFGLYRIKDAIVDQTVDRGGERPRVDVDSPDLYVACYLENRRFSIGIDAAGDPLHMRGYRVAQHPASLREHLAAAMVLHSGWDASKPLHDPFCGSGTILSEAAFIATGTPPSYFRKRFGCMGWPTFDAERFARLRAEAASQRRDAALRISGGDSSEAAVSQARANLASAGFGEGVTVSAQPCSQMEPIEDGFIITNPPYAIRSGELDEAMLAYQQLRDRALLCRGSKVVVLSTGEQFEKIFALRSFKRNRLNNGAIQCVVTQYEIRR